MGEVAAAAERGGRAVASRASKPQQQNGCHRHARSWHAIDSLGNLPLTAGHAVRQVLLLLRLAFKLYSYLGPGIVWVVQLWRLIVYALLLLPGFIRMLAFYFFSPLVKRDVPYGRKVCHEGGTDRCLLLVRCLNPGQT